MSTENTQVRMASSAQVATILDLCARKNYQPEEDYTNLTSQQASEKIALLIAFVEPSEKQVARLKEQLGYIVNGGYMSKEEMFTDAEISRMSGGMDGEMSKTIQAFENFLREHPECLPVSDKQLDYLTDIHTCLSIDSAVKREVAGRYLTRAELKEAIKPHFNLKTAKEFIEQNSDAYAEFRRTAVPMQTIEAFRRAEKLAKGEDLAKATADRLSAIIKRTTVAPTPVVDPETESAHTDIELLNMPVTEVWEMTNALRAPKTEEVKPELTIVSSDTKPKKRGRKPRTA